MRASLEVKDYAGAAKRRAELDVIGVPPELQPAVAVLRGRLAEALAQDKDALDDYAAAVKSSDREAAAEARQLEIALKQKRKEINQADALRELETLAVTWRGDAIELKTLQMLSLIYNETGRYPEALAVARAASKLQPNSEISRQAQDAASALFSDIFLSAKGDDLPPIEALGMFYEFRELTPIGRRGDEMIRRLADRLVAVDLLDQAAELLQYQVDKRLEGAARAQVASKLAMVYLTNRKPDRAIAALRSTRIADLNGELRQQRLLLEARAQSDVGRHDLALDIVSNIHGPRGDPPALRHLLGGAAMARGVRADRTVLRRTLARFQTAEPGRAQRRASRGGRICARRRCDRAGAIPREIRAADDRGGRQARIRRRQQAGRRLQHRICPDREDGGERRYARRLPARDEDPLPRCREQAGLAGRRQGRAGLDRDLAGDRRDTAGWGRGPAGVQACGRLATRA